MSIQPHPDSAMPGAAALAASQDLSATLAPAAGANPAAVEPGWTQAVTEGVAEGLPQSDWRHVEGQLIAGRYRIESAIGHGGYGQVYRARDQLLGRVVALKSLALRSGDAAGQAAVLQEARMIALLDHPQIVPLYDAGLEPGLVWMAMRLVDGESLSGILQKGGLEPERVRSFVRQALSALEHAHRRNLVHRDIKPQNFLLERLESGREHLWLTDFGIAKLISGNTDEHEGAIRGTLCYMSPEQISGKRVDPRTDLFALGSVVYEMLTGRRAFQGQTYAEILASVVHHHPPMDWLEQQAGQPFADFVRRLLSKSCEDRFSSAAEAAAFLDKPVAAPRSWWPFRRRKPQAWDGRDVLVARGLKKGYGLRRKILHGIDLTIPAGAVCALLGRNGCGKSTLIRTCIGLYRPDAGQVSLFGRDPHREGPAVLARLGYVPETPAFPDWMRVSELLQLAQRSYAETWDTATCYRLLERFKLPLEQKVRELSRGMQTKVSLVAALAHRPEFLVLDDPTLGLDAVVLEELIEALQEASRREGTTMLIASHNLEEIERIATHAALLEDGRLLVADALDHLKERICEVRLTFHGEVPRLEKLSHFKTLHSMGQTLTGLVLDTRTPTLAELNALRPASLDTRKLSLRELFVQLLR